MESNRAVGRDFQADLREFPGYFTPPIRPRRQVDNANCAEMFQQFLSNRPLERSAHEYFLQFANYWGGMMIMAISHAHGAV
ncbi:hypothetical protein [Sphingobium chlorophenolicum]|uniref:hypothetical protein n=1 Tax=Sphingobium chlorophenolicum TaxID=46429 RepID=UPI001181425B|nr:hypothetical protein [Sphingobium chlorophenolicum]